MTLLDAKIICCSLLTSECVWGVGGMVLIRKASSQRKICPIATSRDVNVETCHMRFGIFILWEICIMVLCIITPSFRIYCSCSDWLIYHVSCYLFQHHSLMRVHLEVHWVNLMLHHHQPCRKMLQLAGWGAGHFSELKWLSSLHLNKVLSPVLLQWAGLR